MTYDTPMPTETVAGLTIKVPRPNEKITEAGAYRIPMPIYHSQEICPGPSVSSTGLRMVETKSRWAFWSSFDANPDSYPKQDNQAFAFGRAAHCLLLGDEVFEDGYAVLPFDSRRTKAAQEWEQEQIDAGKTVITPSEMDAIGHMARNLRNMPLVQSGILDGASEVSLIWQDDITGLWVKARPDVIQLNGQVLADLKTTSDASLIDCQRSITKYAYDQQFALAIEGIERVFGVTTTDAVVIFAEKTAPYHVRSMPIDADALYFAKMRNRRALNTIADILVNPPLPTFDDDETPYSLPPSLLDKLSEQQAEGLLPNL